MDYIIANEEKTLLVETEKKEVEQERMKAYLNALKEKGGEK